MHVVDASRSPVVTTANCQRLTTMNWAAGRRTDRHLADDRLSSSSTSRSRRRGRQPRRCSPRVRSTARASPPRGPTEFATLSPGIEVRRSRLGSSCDRRHRRRLLGAAAARHDAADRRPGYIVTESGTETCSGVARVTVTPLNADDPTTFQYRYELDASRRVPSLIVFVARRRRGRGAVKRAHNPDGAARFAAKCRC